MTELLVERAGVGLATEEVGEGIPVVLLHGLTATRRYVVMGSKALERSGHRVVAYDARAHGRSSPARAASAYEYSDLARDLESVLDELELERAVLAGASMGAHTIARFALEHPERVIAAAFITPAHDPDTYEDPQRLARWDRLAAGLREGGVEGFLAAYGEPRVPESFRETVLTVVRQRLSAHEHPRALADAVEVVPRSQPFATWSDLVGIEAPAIVVASRDEVDPEHPFAVAERWAQTLPAAELLVEEPGRSPLAWQGAQLSRAIERLAASAVRAGRSV